ncbi:hypothetical protein CAL7716_102810 (plasmid) [Calothrix sp. PCC 7716]|nr:hypothetical protein CAL7716_102810 [Calothrix sp. PCC 7716]
MKSQENEELLAAREEIKFLNEVAESHTLLTNTLKQELLQAIKELTFMSESLTKASTLELGLEEAKVVAGAMLQDDPGSGQLVASLLTAIYGVSIEAQDLKIPNRLDIIGSKFGHYSASKTILKSQELIKYSKELRSQILLRSNPS